MIRITWDQSGCFTTWKEQWPQIRLRAKDSARESTGGFPALCQQRQTLSLTQLPDQGRFTLILFFTLTLRCVFTMEVVSFNSPLLPVIFFINIPWRSGEMILWVNADFSCVWDFQACSTISPAPICSLTFNWDLRCFLAHLCGGYLLSLLLCKDMSFISSWRALSSFWILVS